MIINTDFFCRDSIDCARDLIGANFVFGGCGGRIIETEAYRAEGDPACHTFFRKSAKEFVAQHPAGTAYVYLNYGVHWLFNILTKEPDNIGFVLIRALLPESGVKQMQKRRKNTAEKNLCSGPGKLTQALEISGDYHGCDFLRHRKLRFEAADPSLPILADGRIGISRAQDFPWRFTSADHQSWVSRKHSPLSSEDNDNPIGS